MQCIFGRRGIHIGLWWENHMERPLRNPSHRRVDNMKMDLREIAWGGMDSIDLAQDKDWWRFLLNMVMNL
jgi:hypothetical protein